MAESQMQLEDWLDDLCVRFIINLPQEDLSSVARICFQVEEAQWFYEDFIRPLDPTLPSMSLRTFCLRIFQHCPLLASFSVENHTKAFEEFLQYKTRVPVRGAIMLNHAMDSVVLVKGWKKGANWSFPRGKINKDEDDLDCAVREVYEETGLDLREAGLVPIEKKPKYIEISMREQQLRLYVFRDIPMDTNFQPRTRKEISKIEWYKLSDLPAFRKKGAQNEVNGTGTAANKFYMVAPFLVPLKKWIASQKKADERRPGSGVYSYPHHHLAAEEAATTEDDAWAPARGLVPHQVPAIETLDGATQELQRLLKMQPPTQGLQLSQPSHQDKGSALLSLLQANSSGPKATPMVPQTPLDLTVTEAPQPRKPHHHTNQHPVPVYAQSHGPPPAFQLPTNGPGSWNPAQAPNPDVQRPQQGASASPAYYPASQQVSLAHPQPLPPQVQRAMFDRSAFQEGPSGIPQISQTQQQPRQPQQPQQPQQLQGGIPATTHIPHGSGPVQLSGPSMALLNAFKRDTAPAARSTHVPSSVGAEKPLRDVYPPGHALPLGLPNLLESATDHAQDQRKPSELAGSAVVGPSTQHRSALLGMFKKTTIDAAAQDGRKPEGHAVGGSGVPTVGSAEGKMLLQQLQHRGHGAPEAPSNHVPTNAAPAQHEMRSRDGRERGASYQQESRASRPPPTTQAQVHPTRILQRGQALYEEEQQPVVSPKTLSYGSPAQSRIGHVASPQTAHPVSRIGHQHGRPAEGPADQKRQLLSLFGKQKSPPAGMEAVVTAHPGSRVASMASGSGEPLFGTAAAVSASTSSRRGTETPISPADQTFLLDYLQNVTNTATR
ncbi:5'-(N(7)-methylguanosine 5'-triphospho)-[mRNA] hydrolase [Purpureocillium takamizusanense]|uniref:5'-(N(7)-methylguanosine 5'-triphospho)-[mRNA] hydrolase n=1 Tax=Purpureocillium takamizusanense TaxID=2060973 RepID=A0A9Q8Q6E2_9HYPO|nr:5'-(N(7)-methylguanosine 5'-triphospho)-[mRNA] hydrolase [Purpureocillium takamizusanense]UNI13541.1 5'-(N(7)-methylguanosine 5'-triphospho)-[mRNA] hydrolase [Purpureocillium takamizusanense]